VEVERCDAAVDVPQRHVPNAYDVDEQGDADAVVCWRAHENAIFDLAWAQVCSPRPATESVAACTTHDLVRVCPSVSGPHTVRADGACRHAVAGFRSMLGTTRSLVTLAARSNARSNTG